MSAAVLATIGSVITIAFGVWHLFVPTAWGWYSYIPGEARELAVAVRAINLFFSISLILFGVLMVVFAFRKPMDAFYVRCVALSLTLLWGVRVIAQILWPQGSLNPFLQFGLLGVFAVVFVLFALVAWLIGR